MIVYEETQKAKVIWVWDGMIGEVAVRRTILISHQDRNKPLLFSPSPQTWKTQATLHLHFD